MGVSIPGSLFLTYLNIFGRRRILRLLDQAAEVELAAAASSQGLLQLASDPPKPESAPPAQPRRRIYSTACCCSRSSCALRRHRMVGPRGASELRTVAVSASIRRASRGSLLCTLVISVVGSLYVSLFVTGTIYDWSPIGGLNVAQFLANLILWAMIAAFLVNLDYTHASVNRYLDPPAILAGSERDLVAVTIFESEPAVGEPGLESPPSSPATHRPDGRSDK